MTFYDFLCELLCQLGEACVAAEKAGNADEAMRLRDDAKCVIRRMRRVRRAEAPAE